MKILSFFSGLLLIFCFSFSAFGASAQYNPLETPCNSTDETKNSPACVENKQGQKDAINEQDPISGRNGLISRVVNIIAFASAVVAVVIIIIAGLTLVTSNGDSSKLKTARDTIIYAAVGLIIIALARSIVILVINSTNN